jgi:thiamine pyridinylase
MPCRTLLQVVLTTFLGACTVVPSKDVVLATQVGSIENARVQLRVSLYPWIPDAKSFFAFIESDFESKNPDIDLVVRSLEKTYESDLAYEPDEAQSALTNIADRDFQDLIEIDTLTLGRLATRGAIAPFDVRGASFLPEAAEAVTWNAQRLGVPHWTCGYFVISEDPAIKQAKTVNELMATLDGEGTDRVNLAGDLDGSWDSVTVYLDAFRDTYPGADMQNALQQPELDPVVADQFRKLRSACTKGHTNYCADDAVNLFATGGADALIGFSERLNPVLSHPARTVGDLHIASATLGGGDQPAAFVDALVRSPLCSSEQCLDAAQRFAAYYVSDEVFEVALMALDTQSGVPRYLLPSTRSSLEFGQVAQDRLYSELKQEIGASRAYPNDGVPQAREAGVIRQQMQAALLGL